MDQIVDISKTILETDRLILRPWQESDLDDFFAYASVEGVGEMAGWKPHETAEVSRGILNMFIAEKNVFAVVDKKTDKVIGSLGLHTSWANDEPLYKDLKTKEIGYVLSKAYWGRGLMPEAVSAAIDFCFHTCGIDVLTCGHFSHNVQSKRVIEKCGFTFYKEGVFYAKQLEKSFGDRNYILLRGDINA